jgi:hypothetical protein
VVTLRLVESLMRFACPDWLSIDLVDMLKDSAPSSDWLVRH